MPRRLFPLSATLGTLLAMAAIGPLAAEQTAPANIIGHYRLQGSDELIAIADCGAGQLCGRIEGLGRLLETGNAQQLAQRRQFCGKTVLTGLEPTSGVWQGLLHDPEFGDDYTITLWIQANGTGLKARRYRSAPLLSRSMPQLESWTRVAPPTAACGAATPTS